MCIIYAKYYKFKHSTSTHSTKINNSLLVEPLSYFELLISINTIHVPNDSIQQLLIS